MRTGADGSVAARQTASTTSEESVLGLPGVRMAEMTSLAKPE